jgi:hypothetical protein
MIAGGSVKLVPVLSVAMGLVGLRWFAGWGIQE